MRMRGALKAGEVVEEVGVALADARFLLLRSSSWSELCGRPEYLKL
jgi:hypothetical protein